MSNDVCASNSRVLFTAPWDLEFKRRGDALGLRALTDEFAEAVAPGLTNRVNDGRWVTILAWCLVRSQEVFAASHGQSIATAADQRDRYDWLRPLELMWVARTIELTEKSGSASSNRSMSGQRSVRRWRGLNPKDRFGMNKDQFHAYRQTGMYGGYRVAFLRWPGLTKSCDGKSRDGWTPSDAAIELAKCLEKKLGKARPKWPLNQGVEHPRIRDGGTSAWWLNHWDNFNESARDVDANCLPRPIDDFNKLPNDEADILRKVIFENDEDGKRRHEIAMAIERSGAKSHLDVCKHLATTFSHDRVIADLARFSRLADAGMDAMTLIAESLKSEPARSLKDVASSQSAVTVCKKLHQAALAWCYGGTKEPSSSGFGHRDKATDFARKIQSAEPNECLRAVLQHHTTDGGGLRWFVLSGQQIEPRTLPSNSTASRYRFRLWSLCRLAAQCGVIRQIPDGIGEVSAEDDDDAE